MTVYSIEIGRNSSGNKSLSIHEWENPDDWQEEWAHLEKTEHGVYKYTGPNSVSIKHLIEWLESYKPGHFQADPRDNFEPGHAFCTACAGTGYAEHIAGPYSRFEYCRCPEGSSARMDRDEHLIELAQDREADER